MNRIRIFLFASALVPLVACGGGGGKRNRTLPPSNLAYGASIAYYLPGVPVPANVPSFDGDVDSFEVTPPLPGGLLLDAGSGAITGAPLATSDPATFTITATGPKGSDQTTIEIGVVQPPRLAFAASASDDSITTYVVDPSTGILHLQAVLRTPAGEDAPEALVVHPTGKFVYAVNATNNISHFVVDASTGRLAPRAALATGSGPHTAVLSPAGRHLYVTARGEDAIYVYSVDQVNGELTQVGTPLATAAGPASLTLSPEGTFAYLSQELDGSVRTYAVDATSGALSVVGSDALFPGSSPVGVAVGPAGAWAFVALSAGQAVVPAQVDQVSGVLAPSANFVPTSQSPVAVAVHPTGRFVYAANGGGGELEIYAFDRTAETLIPAGATDLGSLPASIRFDASGLYALVSLPERDMITVYSVDLATGTFQNGLEVPSREAPGALALTIGANPVRRVARHLYVLGDQSDDVQSYAIQAGTGNPSPLGVSLPVGLRPRSLALDPLGRFAFAGGASSGTIYTLIVEADGSLSDSGISLPGDGSPRGIAVDPTGSFLYGAFRNTDVLRSYSIDATTGALTPLDEAAAGTDLHAMNLHPSGRFVYGSNFESSDVTSYRVEEGMFVEGPFTAPATSRPDGIRFSPRGDRAFVGGSSADILIPYRIDTRTGALTPIPPGKGVGNRPAMIELHPSDRWAYAAISDLPTGQGLVRFLLVNTATGGFMGGDAGAEISAGLNPTDLRVDPSGSHLYVLNRTGSDMSIFDLDAETGAPINERRVTTPLAPWSLQISYRLE